MSPKTDAPAIIPDLVIEEDKTHEPSGPRIRCPHCGWDAPQGRPLVLHMRI
jgi:hypothetical protein